MKDPGVASNMVLFYTWKKASEQKKSKQEDGLGRELFTLPEVLLLPTVDYLFIDVSAKDWPFFIHSFNKYILSIYQCRLYAWQQE